MLLTYSRWCCYRYAVRSLHSLSRKRKRINITQSYNNGVYPTIIPWKLNIQDLWKCSIHTTTLHLAKRNWSKDFSQLKSLSLDEAEQQLEQEISSLERQQQYKNVRRKDKNPVNNDLHIPVMLTEVLECFTCKENQTVLDLTFGAGGHSRALLDQIPGCHILALDRDPVAHKMAVSLAEQRPGQITPILGRFSELSTLLPQYGIMPGSLDGALMDLGSSSMQFDQSERGFSISKDAPLDMRMDGQRYPDLPSAADVINNLDETDLFRILKKYGEEPRAKKIAHGIIEARAMFGRISTTHQLADIVTSVCEGGHGYDKLSRHSHAATKTFQALRIFVNNELNELNIGLQLVARYLRVGGVCVAISFHSLEDRIVKRHFQDIDLDAGASLSLAQKRKLRSATTVYSLEEMSTITHKVWEPLDQRLRVPSEEEVESNPRSRSAKLRAARKL